MEEEQGERHCCRFCKKAFPCGRSLGGHMRSHMNMSSIETEERRKAPVNGGSISSSYMGFEAGRRDGYGLRENPKKTWRISDLSGGEFQHAIVCKDCGKEFKSSKALYGHMRSHTDRSHLGLVEDDQKNGGETYKRAFESLSNDDEGDEKKREKSKRGGHGASPTFSFANAAASVLTIEQEKEDGAICLIMLSRDERPWDEANCFSDDSSDNNSVVLEARSSGMYKRSAEKADADFICDIRKSGTTKNRGEKKLDCKVSDSENNPIEKKISKLGKSESGFSRDGIQKVESAASDEEVIEEVEFKSKLDDSDNELKDHETELGVFNWQLRKDSNQKERFYCFDFELASASCKRAWLNGSVTEMDKNSAKLFASNQVNSELMECSLIKRSESDACKIKCGADLYKKIECSVWDEELGKNLYKKSRFKCTTCNKTFHSYQALGGHRSSHKKIKGCFTTRSESSEQRIQTEIGADPIAEESLKFCRLDKLIDTVKGGKISFGPEKIKGHECPICLKVFTSGQALGGHKRSHLVGNSHNRSKTCQSTVIQQEQSHIFNFLDLNLPAPTHDDENGRGGYNSWLIARNHKRDPLVGLISN